MFVWMVFEQVQHFSLTISLGSPESSRSPGRRLWSWENGSSHWILLTSCFYSGLLWCDCDLLEFSNVGLWPGLTSVLLCKSSKIPLLKIQERR